MLIKVRQFLTKKEENPVPLRTMRVQELKRETEKAVLVSLVGVPIPQSECVHCGRTITHPQSLHFGIGSTCIKHFPHLLELVSYNDIEESYKRLQEEMPKITWEGWLPKGHIDMIPEDPKGWQVQFVYQGTTYNTYTEQGTKLHEIQQKAERVLSIKEVF